MTEQTQNSLQIGTSPVNEMDLDSLNQLFSKDPLERTRQDVNEIVRILRSRRSFWKAEEASGKTKSAGAKKPKAPVEKKTATPAAMLDFKANLLASLKKES